MFITLTPGRTGDPHPGRKKYFRVRQRSLLRWTRSSRSTRTFRFFMIRALLTTSTMVRAGPNTIKLFFGFSTIFSNFPKKVPEKNYVGKIVSNFFRFSAISIAPENEQICWETSFIIPDLARKSVTCGRARKSLWRSVVVVV